MKKMPSSSSSSGTGTANGANSGATGTNSNREANSSNSNPSNSSNGKNDNTNTNSGASKHTNSDNHVRIVQNSESDLQALFDSVLKPDSKRPLQVPWHMRNLPDSFFTPPSTGSKSPSVLSISHSRENSADAAFGTNTTPAGLQLNMVDRYQAQRYEPPRRGLYLAKGVTNVKGILPYEPRGKEADTECALEQNDSPYSTIYDLKVNHPRAHSSPASLQQTYASAQQKTPPQAPQGVHSHIKQRSYDMGATVVDELGPLPPGWEQARTSQGQVYYLK
ncbi:hypothetical protein RUM43_013990 [Polyplax serrata]|uniref:WW domain-containing protein n=1 Tax=Polyplax serrata TaxID=468196 RepID=A0AAN8RS76_POLSC